MLGAAALIALGAPALGQQAVLVSADVATFENGYRTGFMQGSKVFNERKERIGTIADFVRLPVTEAVDAFATLAFESREQPPVTDNVRVLFCVIAQRLVDLALQCVDPQ